MQVTSKLDNVIAWGLVVTLMLMALAQGTVEPWSQFLFLFVMAALLLLWGVKAARERQWVLYVSPLTWPLAALTGFAFVQSWTWLDSAGQVRSLSFDPESTRGAAWILLALLIGSLLGANFLTESQRLRQLMNVLTFYGFGLATLALIQHVAANDAAYWPRPIAGRGTFGPFINRDHFAGYMELLLPLPLALIITRAVTGQRRLVYGVAASMMGIALVFTLSRGGLISLFAELLVLAAFGFKLLPRRRHTDERALPWLGAATGALVLIVILSGVIWIGAEPVIDRLATTASDPTHQQTFHNLRGAIWQDTWRVFRANPWWGTGLGAFETSFPLYALDRGEDGLTAQAHNDYLQILADGGLLGGCLAGWFLVVFVRSWLRSLQPRQFHIAVHTDAEAEHWRAGAALGCGAGVAGLLIHSFFDFNLQLPSHALLFLVLSAIVTRLAASTATATVSQKSPAMTLTSEMAKGVSL